MLTFLFLSAECIYVKAWDNDSVSQPVAKPASTTSDEAKLIFGSVFSLRNMVRKLGGDDDAFISYRTGQYKLHFYETPANLRFVMMTDTAAPSMRNVLHQIYINLWVEYGILPLILRRQSKIANSVGNSGQESPIACRAQGRRRCQERAV